MYLSSMAERYIEEAKVENYIEKGYIHTHTIFEIAGSPKSHVEKTLKEVMGKLEEADGIKLVLKDTGEPEKNEDDVWATFCETEILFDNIYKLSWVVINLVPSSLEFLAPETLSFKEREMTELFMDILAHLHEVNMERVKISNANQALQKNTHAILRNGMLLAIKNGARTPKEIGEPLGVEDEEKLNEILNAMMKEGTIVKTDEGYVKA